MWFESVRPRTDEAICLNDALKYARLRAPLARRVLRERGQQFTAAFSVAVQSIASIKASLSVGREA